MLTCNIQIRNLPEIRSKSQIMTMATKRADSADVLNEEQSSKKTKAFRFNDEHVDNLISCLLDYKIKCELDNIDFDADKPAQYSKIREDMVDIYKEQ